MESTNNKNGKECTRKSRKNNFTIITVVSLLFQWTFHGYLLECYALWESLLQCRSRQVYGMALLSLKFEQISRKIFEKYRIQKYDKLLKDTQNFFLLHPHFITKC